MAKRRKSKEDIIEHISTEYSIKDGINCASCPLKLYAKNDTVKLGVGNIYSNYIFVLPPYDFNANINYNTILSILQKEYKAITGNELLENVYVTRAIKCYEYSPYEMMDNSIHNCKDFLWYEFGKLNQKHIVLFGNVYDMLVNLDNPNINYFLYNRFIHKVYNPAVMYYNDTKLQQEFVKQLTEAINDNF